MAIRKLLCALAVTAPMAAPALAGALDKTVAEDLEIAPTQNIRISLDKGAIKVLPGDANRIKYRVDFAPDRGWFFSEKPSAKDYEDSTAAYDKKTGELKITTGRRMGATVKVYVPTAQALDAHIEAGTAEIGPLAGKLDAYLGVGTLTYDASGLAEGACVDAALKIGVVNNGRDRDCKGVGAKLRAHTGTITVE